jgi:hypothetical protein
MAQFLDRRLECAPLLPPFDCRGFAKKKGAGGELFSGRPNMRRGFLLPRDLVEARREAFLKSSIALSAWAW